MWFVGRPWNSHSPPNVNQEPAKLLPTQGICFNSSDFCIYHARLRIAHCWGTLEALAVGSRASSVTQEPTKKSHRTMENGRLQPKSETAETSRFNFCDLSNIQSNSGRATTCSPICALVMRNRSSNDVRSTFLFAWKLKLPWALVPLNHNLHASFVCNCSFFARPNF